MIGIKLLEEIIFGSLSILSLFAIHYSITVFRALFKHRKDKAPLTSYLLNPQMAKIPYFIYAGFFGFLTGVMAFMDYLDKGFNPATSLQYFTFLSGFIFAILTAIFIVLDLRFWYIRFKRFV